MDAHKSKEDIPTRLRNHVNTIPSPQIVVRKDKHAMTSDILFIEVHHIIRIFFSKRK